MKPVLVLTAILTLNKVTVEKIHLTYQEIYRHN